jgi:hypothetical protein
MCGGLKGLSPLVLNKGRKQDALLPLVQWSMMLPHVLQAGAIKIIQAVHSKIKTTSGYCFEF